MQRQNYMITAEEVAESMGISLGYAYKLLRISDSTSLLGNKILWIFPDCNVKGARKYGSIQR